jgi:predicted transcriptional regulator
MKPISPDKKTTYTGLAGLVALILSIGGYTLDPQYIHIINMISISIMSIVVAFLGKFAKGQDVSKDINVAEDVIKDVTPLAPTNTQPLLNNFEKFLEDLNNQIIQAKASLDQAVTQRDQIMTSLKNTLEKAQAQPLDVPKATTEEPKPEPTPEAPKA